MVRVKGDEYNPPKDFSLDHLIERRTKEMEMATDLVNAVALASTADALARINNEDGLAELKANLEKAELAVQIADDYQKTISARPKPADAAEDYDVDQVEPLKESLKESKKNIATRIVELRDAQAVQDPPRTVAAVINELTEPDYSFATLSNRYNTEIESFVDPAKLALNALIPPDVEIGDIVVLDVKNALSYAKHAIDKAIRVAQATYDAALTAEHLDTATPNLKQAKGNLDDLDVIKRKLNLLRPDDFPLAIAIDMPEADEESDDEDDDIIEIEPQKERTWPQSFSETWSGADDSKPLGHPYVKDYLFGRYRIVGGALSHILSLNVRDNATASEIFYGALHQLTTQGLAFNIAFQIVVTVFYYDLVKKENFYFPEETEEDANFKMLKTVMSRSSIWENLSEGTISNAIPAQVAGIMLAINLGALILAWPITHNSSNRLQNYVNRYANANPAVGEIWSILKTMLYTAGFIAIPNYIMLNRVVNWPIMIPEPKLDNTAAPLPDDMAIMSPVNYLWTLLADLLRDDEAIMSPANYLWLLVAAVVIGPVIANPLLRLLEEGLRALGNLLQNLYVRCRNGPVQPGEDAGLLANAHGQNGINAIDDDHHEVVQHDQNGINADAGGPHEEGQHEQIEGGDAAPAVVNVDENQEEPGIRNCFGLCGPKPRAHVVDMNA